MCESKIPLNWALAGSWKAEFRPSWRTEWFSFLKGLHMHIFSCLIVKGNCKHRTYLDMRFLMQLGINIGHKNTWGGLCFIVLIHRKLFVLKSHWNLSDGVIVTNLDLTSWDISITYFLWFGAQGFLGLQLSYPSLAPWLNGKGRKQSISSEWGVLIHEKKSAAVLCDREKLCFH